MDNFTANRVYQGSLINFTSIIDINSYSDTLSQHNGMRILFLLCM